MLKKVVPIVLTLCLLFSISVMAENPTGNENIPSTSSERPMRGNFDPSKMPEGFTPSEDFRPPQSNNSNENAELTVPEANEKVTEENSQATENNKETGQTQNENSPFGGQIPQGVGGFPGNMQNGQNSGAEQPTGFWGFVKTYSTPITSVVLLGLAYLFVVFYKRKHY